MKRFLKEKLGLTDSGVKAVKVSSVFSFLVNVGYMGLMMIAMYFAYNTLRGEDHAPWHYVIIIAVVLVFTYIVVNMEYVKTFNATYGEAKELRLELADRLKELPLSYFSKHNLSDMAQTVMQDVLDLEHAMSHAMPRCIAYVFFVIVVSVMLLACNIWLGLATVIPLLIGFLMMYVSKNVQIKWTSKYFWKTRENTEVFQETIELQREIKSYGLTEEKSQQAYESLSNMEKLRLKSEVAQVLPLLLSTTFIKLVLGVVSVVAAALLRENSVELIYVIGYVLAAIKMIDAMGAMEESFAELLYIDARVKRLNELRSAEIQHGKDVELKDFDIQLENVVFGYNEEVDVVKNISFTAKQNQVTAIVGPSGCGKSTLLRLISRLYDYNSGKIIIDGYDIKDISTNSLFDKISFVFQDVILFNASVMDNIRMGRPDATDDEVVEAAKMANCDEFIKKLPQSYYTLIGENGSKLSGGERQRISIARAFLKNAPILLLDEISASLDVENERKIQESLNKLIAGKTVIIISHRLKSIEQVDKIVVMDDGQVDAVGTHGELLGESSLYRKLIEKSSLTEEFRY